MTVPPREPRKVLFRLWGVDCHKPRAPRRYFNEISGGEILFPLIVLVGLNAVNQLDQTAFAVLGPDIRAEFGLSYGAFLALIGITLVGGLVLTVPLAYYSDRVQRVALAVVGGAIWAVFGFLTGLVVTLLMLVLVRSFAGIGRAVITPTHNSLLADYYPPEVRTDVFGFHQIGLAIGATIGPLVGGLLGQLYGWRVPFIVFTIPSVVFVILGMRMREPGAVTGSAPPWVRRHTSSGPTRFPRRSRSRSVSCGRSERCGGSGTRCRSSAPRSWVSSC